MKAIAIDDEQLALEHLKKVISEFPEIELIQTFQNSLLALEAISEYHPNVVFIDIEMPGLSGVDVAKEILKEFPSMHIVFVTAYREYSIAAFEMDAVDYLVKPIYKERFEKTVERVKKLTEVHQQYRSTKDRVNCFGEVSFQVNRKREVPIWRTKKAEELFHYLIHHRDQYIHRDEILAELWPNVDFETAQAQLYTTVYQIRQTIEKHEINIEIVNTNKRYRLILHGLAVDVDILYDGIRMFEAYTEEEVIKISRYLELYEGHLFAGRGYLWVESYRENLRKLWFSYMVDMIKFLISKNRLSIALRLSQNLKNIEPYEEEGYFFKMKIYGSLHQGELVQETYDELVEMQRTEFDEQPRKEIRDWFQAWKQKVSV